GSDSVATAAATAPEPRLAAACDSSGKSGRRRGMKGSGRAGVTGVRLSATKRADDDSPPPFEALCSRAGADVRANGDESALEAAASTDATVEFEPTSPSETPAKIDSSAGASTRLGSERSS